MDLQSFDISQPVAVTGSADANGSGAVADRIDLLPKPVIKPRCPRSSANEIVVCAPDQEQYRLRPLPPTYESATSGAEVGLGQGATAGVAAEGAGVGGWVSNRVMVRVKLKF